MQYTDALKKYVNELYPVHDNTLIFLQGHSGAGKDTLADMLVYWLPNVSVHKYSFAMPLKLTAAKLSGYPVDLFICPDTKDKPFPKLDEPRAITTNLYVDYAHKEHNYPYERMFDINKTWTPRKLLCELGASRDYYPKNLWAECVANQIKADSKKMTDTFGEDKPNTFHIITDLRYPHEYDIVAQEFADWHKVVFYLDTDFASGVDHESDKLMDDVHRWRHVDRVSVPVRTRVQLAPALSKVITRPELANPLSKEIMLHTVVSHLLSKDFLRDHE